MERPLWQVGCAVAIVVLICVGGMVLFGPIGIIFAIVGLLAVGAVGYGARPRSPTPPGT